VLKKVKTCWLSGIPVIFIIEMGKVITVLFFIVCLAAIKSGRAQTIQQGLLLKSGTDIRLGSVRVLNKRSGIRAMSNTAGVFNIAALAGDTLTFNADNFQLKTIVISDLSDRIIYLDPAIQLSEVTIKENELKSNIREAMRGYREKSVFYNGNPHYYYLVLKPMTFIYENFKSEKIFARRFAKYAKRELAANEVDSRFNDDMIKKSVPLREDELEDFRILYAPSLQQLRKMSDYDMLKYIRECYQKFRKDNVKPTGKTLKNSSGRKIYEVWQTS
jgi:hypothetical protein